MGLTHLSLFSGIGGLDLAAEWAGFETVGQCEIADYPTKVLEKHWPDVPRWRDIRELTAESFYERTGLRTVDAISGGFPCQPFSVAGEQRGTEDDRYLWPEMLRVIKELKPTWVIAENVPNIVNMALDEVLSSLESAGYQAGTLLIPACGVGAWHKRERVAILGYASGSGLCGSARRRDGQEPSDGLRRAAQPGVCGMDDGLSDGIYWPDTDLGSDFFTRSGFQEMGGGGYYKHNLHELVEASPDGIIGRLNPTWAEWLMGYPIGWTELNV